MSDPTRLEFKSTIPTHLLKNASPEMAYLMNELSKNTSATEYLLEKTDMVSQKLDYTNSKIAKAATEIAELERKERERVKIEESKRADWEVVKELGQITNLFKKRWFIALVVVSSVFIFGFIYPNFVLTGSLGVVGHIAKWFVG